MCIRDSIVSDVEYIANEILIMKNGELIQHGSHEEILKPIEKCVWECDVSRKEAEELELHYVTCLLYTSLPEGWTKYGADGVEIRPLQRYKALGNAIALPVSYTHLDVYKRQSQCSFPKVKRPVRSARSFWML